MPTTATSLSNLMAGRAVAAGDHHWDAARQAFNTLLDQRPEAVVLPADESDVVAAVRFARERGLRIAPQATAHNAGPLGDQGGSLLVQVSQLGEVSIDPGARRVRVGAGVKWERVGPRLSELGLAGLHGSSPDVGIAGYSLGGGMGWLARKHGLQTNSVTAIELVTADGHLVRTDPVHEPELFWALRGGGGNFGVVTAIEFAVYPLAELYGGAMFFPMDQASDVLHAWRELLPALPEELMTWANLFRFPDDPELPEPLRGGAYAVVMAAFQGDEADGRELLRPVRELGPEIDTLAMGPPAILAELAMDPPDPLPFLLGHQLLEIPPAAAIDDLLAVAGRGSGAALNMVQLRHMGGALAREAPGAGARATLPGDICLVALGVVDSDARAAAVGASLEAVEAALLPHRAGFYPNFVEEPADASAFFDQKTWARLREVKALYDPEDLFRGNHHIPPAALEEQAAA
jgi:FAD/FMN-containing dehydrogenase